MKHLTFSNRERTAEVDPSRSKITKSTLGAVPLKQIVA